MMTATMTMMMMAVVVVVTANSFRCCFVHTRSPFYLHSLMWVFKSLCHMKYTNTSTACGEFYWRHVHPCFSWKLRVISPRHQTGSRHGVRSYKNLQQQQVFYENAVDLKSVIALPPHPIHPKNSYPSFRASLFYSPPLTNSVDLMAFHSYSHHCGCYDHRKCRVWDLVDVHRGLFCKRSGQREVSESEQTLRGS